MLDDMVGWWLQRENVLADEKRVWGPPKWQYTDGNPLDTFDFYAASGCPNCGSDFDVKRAESLFLQPPTLVCFHCGHRCCPLHFDTESDTFLDRLEGRHLTDGRQNRLPNGPNSSVKPVEERLEEVEATPLPGAVYLRGTRSKYDFGQNGKKWWQSRFLPEAVRRQELRKRIESLGLMSKLKAPTVEEVCEICGNALAYFHTYQARSADEGMTIMYECTRCGSRKTFNN
eukprot:Polyplicarium_translucidae@DN1668_c0_g1_i1.p1